MIKTLIAAVLLAAPCFGQSVFRVQKFCEVGGQKAVTQGLNSVTNIQRSFPKCTVTVYLTGTTTIAAIFSDNLGPPTPLANPFTANVDGSWGFYASTASCYDVVTSGGNPGDTFPSPFTYSNICVGGGGGGTGVNPGTPYQVTRYDPTGVNIQDSTGSDNPANGPTRWVQGLSVEGNAGYRMFVNSSAGTTTNLLVCRDTSVTSITEVTTCPVSSNSVFGLADNGSGATGNVRVAMIGFHSCVFDGQTVVGDWAIPSATNAGQCSDAGASKPTTQQVLGHVTTLNTGAATLATVDLWTGDTISGGGATVAIAPCTITGCFAYYTTPNSIGGDNHTNLDGFGNGQLGSLGLTDATHSGFWYETAGPTPPPAPTSSTLFFVDSTIATPNSFKLPKAAGAADIGKAWGVTSNTTDTNGNPVDIMGIISAGSSTEVQVNGVDTTAQTPINFQNTSTVTFTNPSAGVIQAATVAAANKASNPSAPTLTPNTPGSTAYSYAVVGCEDVNCAFHSAMSGVTATSTGNANLATGTMKLTAYADTLYGYRFYKICRTASSGTPASIGVIATGAGKQFIDNGLVGDGTTCASTFASNTTQLDTHCLASSLPAALNVMPGAPCGVDAPPTSPNASDDEGTPTFGAPADANNPVWSWQDQNSSTAAWTGGMMKIAYPDNASTDKITCITEPTPSQTGAYTYVGIIYTNWTATTSHSNTSYFGFFETGPHYQVIGIQSQNSTSTSRYIVTSWTSNTAVSLAYTGDNNSLSPPNPTYYKVASDGTNLTYAWSPDGVTYTQLYTQTRTSSPFSTGPTAVGFCGDGTVGAFSQDTDYFRRTQ